MAALYAHSDHIEIALALDEDHPEPSLKDASHLTWRTLPLSMEVRSLPNVEMAEKLIDERMRADRTGTRITGTMNTSFGHRAPPGIHRRGDHWWMLIPGVPDGMKPTELAFEDAIEASLLTDGGYLKSGPANFDPVLGLDTRRTLRLHRGHPAHRVGDLVALYGNDPPRPEPGSRSGWPPNSTTGALWRSCAMGSSTGVTFRLAYFKPAHGLTDTLTALYAANRVTVTRQLAFESGTHKTLDIALLVNGIPTATAELKNPLTNQTVEHAIEQYRNDRDPANTTLSRRALVHFAVDPERGGHDDQAHGDQHSIPALQPRPRRGSGQPTEPAGHRTSYLWEKVWERDAWMDLLARFIHVERPTQGSRLPEEGCRDGHLPPLPPVGRRPEAGSRRQGQRCRAELPHRALGRVR